MGNVPISCCRSESSGLQHSVDRGSERNNEYSSVKQSSKKSITNKKGIIDKYANRHSGDKNDNDNDNQASSHILQHISEREPDDSETDPSSNPFNRPIFAARSRSSTKTSVNRMSNSHQHNDFSFSSSNSTSQKQTIVTPLMSSQDCGYNSTTSTNLSHLDRQINDSFDISIQRDQQARIPQTRHEYYNKFGQSNSAITTSGSDFANTSSGFSDNLLLQLNSPTESGNITSSNTFDGPNGSNCSQNLRKSSSCSTILTDGSTISQPDFKQTIRCVSLAIYYHIKNRTSDNSANIFDESVHPLKMPEQSDTERNDDQQMNDDDDDEVGRLIILDQDEDSNDGCENTNLRTIYSFVKTLFKAAQLTSEYAITTLVYLERLMTYAEMDLTPKTWRRMFLGAILLSSKVWEDQAVWNVDYAQILEEISVDDINELESQFLELIQFNMNVPSSVYAKYYFHLRTLALKNGLSRESKLLTVGEARNIEAMSRVHSNDWQSSPIHRKTSPTVKRHTSLEKLRLNGFAKAVLM